MKQLYSKLLFHVMLGVLFVGNVSAMENLTPEAKTQFEKECGPHSGISPVKKYVFLAATNIVLGLEEKDRKHFIIPIINSTLGAYAYTFDRFSHITYTDGSGRLYEIGADGYPGKNTDSTTIAMNAAGYLAVNWGLRLGVNSLTKHTGYDSNKKTSSIIITPAVEGVAYDMATIAILEGIKWGANCLNGEQK